MLSKYLDSIEGTKKEMPYATLIKKRAKNARIEKQKPIAEKK